jgi:hypothetical protein
MKMERSAGMIEGETQWGRSRSGGEERRKKY